MNEISVDLLLRHFDVIGCDLVWSEPTAARCKKGDVAGSIDKDGYRCVKFMGKSFKSHRIVWAMAHGVWPSMELDHINLIKDDNSPCNLREVSRFQNMANVSSKKGLSHHKGVCFSKKAKQWVSAIYNYKTSKRVHLGYFDRELDAAKAYQEAAIDIHGVHAYRGAI